MGKAEILVGDVIEMLKTLPPASVHCVVTSPPYWGLRDYGVEGQGGLEDTPEEHVVWIVEVFREVARVLRADGTAWVNYGDSYASQGGTETRPGSTAKVGNTKAGIQARCRTTPGGLKSKDLVGMPWLVAKALQAPYYDGRIKNEKDRAWLAAIIDGEGTICGTKHTRKDDGRTRTTAQVFVTNSCELMLDRCGEIWPAPRHAHMKNSEGHFGHRDVFRWTIGGSEEKSVLLRELYPYFISKRAQALLAWNLLEYVKDGRRLGKSQAAPEVRDKREHLCDLMSRANHGEPVDVPGWCKEPPSLYSPGWYLRSDIIWHKPNPMPESVTDRPTKSHEHLFLLAHPKSKGRYFYDADAVREDAPSRSVKQPDGWDTGPGSHGSVHRSGREKGKPNAATVSGRNLRDVLTIATQPYPEAHFATFPEALVKPCIKAGCPAGGTVLDPFAGSGTTLLVALRLGRKAVGIELNPEYAAMARRRLKPHIEQQTLF